ncbi:MAG: hypothetical protein AAB467_02140, partial [Patescibacteria group bacterium]
NPGAAIVSINEQAEEGVNLDQFAFELLETLRSMLLLLMNADKNAIKSEYSDETMKEMRALATELQANKLVTLMDLALKRRGEIKYAPMPQLPLELLAVEGAAMIASSPALPSSQVALVAKSIPRSGGVGLKAGGGLVNVVSQTTTLANPPLPRPSGELAKTIKTTFSQIQSRWSELVKNASNIVPSLGFILSMCTLKEINGNVLTLAVPYQLHKDKLESAKNKSTLEQCLETTFAEKLSLNYAIVSPKNELGEVNISNLAADFGGVVV